MGCVIEPEGTNKRMGWGGVGGSTDGLPVSQEGQGTQI